MANRAQFAFSRRAFLAASGIGAAALATGAASRSSTRRKLSSSVNIQQGMIDVHHHPTIQSFRELYNGVAATAMASWSVQKSLEDMDQAGVATSLLSLPPPVQFWTNPKDRVLAQVREWNEFMTSLSRDYQNRFGVLAVLPVPYPDASLREIAHAFDTLKVIGVGITTNIGNRWLGDPLYIPMLDELNRRKAIVFVHPVAASCCQGLLSHITDATIEFPVDTTRAIARLLFSGTATRFPHIKFIFCHAGGTMPFTVERFLLVPKFNPEVAAMLPNGVLPQLQRFYYDVALSANPYAMSSVKQLVPTSQLLFGTDFPFGTAADTAKGLADCGLFNDNELAAIARGNMQRILPVTWGLSSTSRVRRPEPDVRDRAFHGPFA